VNPILLF